MAETIENNQGGTNVQGEANDLNNGQQEPAEKKFTQADVDRIVQERLAREKSKTQEPKNTEQVQQQNPVDTSAFDTQIAEVRSQLVSAKVESVMATSGVRPEKIERAVRLVDTSKCVNKEGFPDTEKIKKEIEDLLKDFPELKNTSEEASTGFKFGANSNSKGDASETASKVSAIFGNKK